jgi:hypothetical protein
MASTYPIVLEVDPAAPQNRLTVFFRLLMIIPQAIVLAFVGIAAYIVTIIAWFVILFTGTYPEGMLRFAIGALRWGIRVQGYAYLLTDRYPPFSLEAVSDYPIRPDAAVQSTGRNRLTVFFRIIMIIPHAIIVQVLGYAVAVVVFIGWVAALFTGSVPEGLHNFVAGYCRWYARYIGYAMLLRDEYPPFSLS